MSSTPTDAELDALRQADNGALNFVTLRQFRTVARAVLAKWGTQQPAHSEEPVAWKHDCAALLTNDVELWIDACPHCGKPRNAPQPVEREPMTREQVKAICVESGYETATLQERADFINGIRHAELHHGIKGGQHGAT